MGFLFSLLQILVLHWGIKSSLTGSNRKEIILKKYLCSWIDFQFTTNYWKYYQPSMILVKFFTLQQFLMSLVADVFRA